MTALVQILIVFGAISLVASVLVVSACIRSGQVGDVGRMSVVDTDSGESGSEREAENVFV